MSTTILIIIVIVFILLAIVISLIFWSLHNEKTKEIKRKELEASSVIVDPGLSQLVSLFPYNTLQFIAANFRNTPFSTFGFNNNDTINNLVFSDLTGSDLSGTVVYSVLGTSYQSEWVVYNIKGLGDAIYNSYANNQVINQVSDSQYTTININNTSVDAIIVTSIITFQQIDIDSDIDISGGTTLVFPIYARPGHITFYNFALTVTTTYLNGVKIPYSIVVNNITFNSLYINVVSNAFFDVNNYISSSAVSPIQSAISSHVPSIINNIIPESLFQQMSTFLYTNRSTITTDIGNLQAIISFLQRYINAGLSNIPSSAIQAFLSVLNRDIATFNQDIDAIEYFIFTLSPFVYYPNTEPVSVIGGNIPIPQPGAIITVVGTPRYNYLNANQKFIPEQNDVASASNLYSLLKGANCNFLTGPSSLYFVYSSSPCVNCAVAFTYDNVTPFTNYYFNNISQGTC